MLTSVAQLSISPSQIAAAMIGVAVFIGLMSPSYARYAILGGIGLVLVNIALSGTGSGIFHLGLR